MQIIRLDTPSARLFGAVLRAVEKDIAMNFILKNTVIAIGVFVASEMLLSACLRGESSVLSQEGPRIKKTVQYEDESFSSGANALAWLETKDPKFTKHGGVIDSVDTPEIFYEQEDENGDWFTVVRGEDGKFYKPREDAVRASQSQSESDNGAGH